MLSFVPVKVVTSAATTLVVETLVETSMMATILATLEVEEAALGAAKTTWGALEAKEVKAVASTTSSSSSNSSSNSNSRAAIAIRWEEVVVEAALVTKATPSVATQAHSTLLPAVETSARSLLMGRVQALVDQVLEARCPQG